MTPTPSPSHAQTASDWSFAASDGCRVTIVSCKATRGRSNPQTRRRERLFVACLGSNQHRSQYLGPRRTPTSGVLGDAFSSATLLAISSLVDTRHHRRTADRAAGVSWPEMGGRLPCRPGSGHRSRPKPPGAETRKLAVRSRSFFSRRSGSTPTFRRPRFGRYEPGRTVSEWRRLQRCRSRRCEPQFDRLGCASDTRARAQSTAEPEPGLAPPAPRLPWRISRPTGSPTDFTGANLCSADSEERTFEGRISLAPTCRARTFARLA